MNFVSKNIFLSILILGDYMEKLIGHTPMIKIYYKYQEQVKYVYSKLEYFNLTGSIKDRMAYYIIQKSKEDGSLLDGMPIIEATSGNTGISFSAIGTYYHHPVYIFMPDWVSHERVSLMESFGAHVTLISKEDGGFQRCIYEADRLALKLNGFRPNQFSNPYNVMAHYETTGKEISSCLDSIDGFASGVGTGGTLIGIAKKLKEKNPNVFIAALEPDTLPLMSTGCATGSHLIEGIGDDFVPDLMDLSMVDNILLINDEDAINMSRKLASNLGLGVGISSGANLLAAVLLHEKVDGNIVTVFADDQKKYLSTKLLDPVDYNPNFVSNQISLIGYEVIDYVEIC